MHQLLLIVFEYLNIEGIVLRKQSPDVAKFQSRVSYLSCCVQFNMPVEVTWNKISDKLLKNFWARHPAERQGLADISDRILVFHRGIKEVQPDRLCSLTQPSRCGWAD